MILKKKRQARLLKKRLARFEEQLRSYIVSSYMSQGMPGEERPEQTLQWVKGVVGWGRTVLVDSLAPWESDDDTTYETIARRFGESYSNVLTKTLIELGFDSITISRVLREYDQQEASCPV